LAREAIKDHAAEQAAVASSIVGGWGDSHTILITDKIHVRDVDEKQPNLSCLKSETRIRDLGGIIMRGFRKLIARE
jgi:hypothetical protein